MATPFPMDKKARIYVSGHTGLVGSAIIRALRKRGFRDIITASHKELDLRDQRQTNEFFARERPEYVFMAAATVGGIMANENYPARFIYDNLMIQTNTIDAAWRNKCKKLLFLGSCCIYPKFAPQPMPETCLLSGPLEPTNESYAVAKIAGIKMCQAYRAEYGFDAITIMPVNLYGPGDNFHSENSHVLPALMRRFHEAREAGKPSVAIWGTGGAMREFMHVDDLGDACVFLMENYSGPEPVNCGYGEETSILDLAKMVAGVVGYAGRMETDPSKPDGTPRKFADSSKLFGMGWKPSIPLKDGLESTYAWYAQNVERARK